MTIKKKIDEISSDATTHDLLKQLDTNKDGFLESKEVDSDNDGFIDCNVAIQNKWATAQQASIEKALFDAKLVTKLKETFCMGGIPNPIEISPDFNLIFIDGEFSSEPHTFTNSSNWWSKHQYTLPNFFELNPSITRKDHTRLSISALTKALKPKIIDDPFHKLLEKNHFFTLPNNLSYNFIPTGRIGDGLIRDESFYSAANKYLNNRTDLHHLMFYNYTGHQAPIGAALAEKGIPVYWQLNGDERIINAAQDYHKSFQNNRFDITDSAAILLEPNHGGTRILTDRLPTGSTLNSAGIYEIVVFSEEPINKPTDLEIAFIPDQNFKNYLLSLQSQDLKITIVGLEQFVGL